MTSRKRIEHHKISVMDRAKNESRLASNKKIVERILKLIQQRIDENNSSLSLSLKLVCSNKSGLNLIAKLFLGNGVRNFIILAGEDSKTLSENLGYAGADLMLAFQTWGHERGWSALFPLYHSCYLCFRKQPLLQFSEHPPGWSRWWNNCM